MTQNKNISTAMLVKKIFSEGRAFNSKRGLQLQRKQTESMYNIYCIHKFKQGTFFSVCWNQLFTLLIQRSMPQKEICFGSHLWNFESMTSQGTFITVLHSERDECKLSYRMPWSVRETFWDWGTGLEDKELWSHFYNCLLTSIHCFCTRGCIKMGKTYANHVVHPLCWYIITEDLTEREKPKKTSTKLIIYSFHRHFRVNASFRSRRREWFHFYVFIAPGRDWQDSRRWENDKASANKCTCWWFFL